MSTPRHELAPTTRFADRATDYARFRPSYPKEAIDYALEGLSVEADLAGADIGAGTGIASRLFAERGVRVIAVEPNEAMRATAEAHPLVSFRDGTAEATGLDTASMDLVWCAQAFHWFKPVEALAEFRRILKPAGRMVFLANVRSKDDAATIAYNKIIRAAADRELSEGLDTAIEDALSLAQGPVAEASFPFAQALSREGLVGRARSASYVPQSGLRYEEMLRALDDLWNRHRDGEGLVSLRYRTRVWRVDSV